MNNNHDRVLNPHAVYAGPGFIDFGRAPNSAEYARVTALMKRQAEIDAEISEFKEGAPGITHELFAMLPEDYSP